MKSARIHPVAKPMADLCNRFYASGLAPGTSGQASTRDDDLLWITPPDISFQDMKPEHLIALCPDGRLLGEETERLASRLNWHQALYQAATEVKSIIVAKPPKLCALAQYQYETDAQANSLSLPGWSQAITIVPPQSDDSRAQAVSTAFQSSRCLIEIGFGIIIAADTLTTIFNTLEDLESVIHPSLNAAFPHPFPVIS
jgi:ribulose-5-phosphate 4-epimerase/fuculose-1-phosphate aldolase